MGWAPYSDGLSGASIVDVLFDPRAEGVVYATSANTVYQSTDSGRTWHAQGRFEGGSVGYLALVGSDPKNLMATSSSGVIASRDGGKTWIRIALEGIDVRSISVHPLQPLRAYAGVSGGGIFRSDDGGKTWTAINNSYPALGTNALAISVDPADPDVVVVGGILESGSDGVVVRTADGGQTWETVAQGNGNVWNVTRCISNPSVLYVASDKGVLRSGDGGQTWGLTPLSTTVEDVAITPGTCDDVYAMAYTDGPRRSTDGGQTFGPPLMNGVQLNPVGTWPGRMAVDPQQSGGIVLGSHGGIWVTANYGVQWGVAKGLLGMVVRALNVSPMDPARLWLASWGSGVWQRPSASQPWQRVSSLPADYTFAAAAHPSFPNRVLVGSWYTLYQSNDASSFTADSVSENEFAFAFDPKSPNVLYATTELNGVYKSTDSGATWTAVNSGITPWDEQQGQPVIDVGAIAVDPLNSQTLYVGTNGRGVYKSTDGAQTWTSVLAPTERVNCVLAVSATRTRVFACVAGSGIQVSDDEGASWADASDGLSTLDVNGLVQDVVTGDLYATTTTGVFVRRGTQPWVGFDAYEVPSLGASAPAIIGDVAHRSLVVAAGGGVYAHPL